MVSFYLIFFLFLTSYIKFFHKPMICLLSLEGLMITIIFFFIFFYGPSCSFFLLFFIILLVLDSVLGISLLILNCRSPNFFM